MINKIKELLGNDADSLLGHKCNTIPKEDLHLPGPDFIDRIWKDSDRSPNVLRNMQSIFDRTPGRYRISQYCPLTRN
jgi:class I fructose-bisphosphate aldolase